MLVRSASSPSAAAPRPPRPKEKPKNMPATSPTGPAAAPAHRPGSPGRRRHDEGHRPRAHRSRTGWRSGSISAKGSAPRIENHITGMRPTLSPTGRRPACRARLPIRKANRRTARPASTPELLDQIEGEVGAEARPVDVLGEEQRDQDRHEPEHVRREGRRRAPSRRRRARAAPGRRAARTSRRPGAARYGDKGGGENQTRLCWPRGTTMKAASSGPERLAEIAADLEQRLGETVATARGHARHARGFGMEHRRAHADQRRGESRIIGSCRVRHQQQADQGEAHAEHQGIGLRLPVGVDADDRLQHRCRALEGEGDQADLGEGEAVAVLEDRVDRRHQRLHACRSASGRTSATG